MKQTTGMKQSAPHLRWLGLGLVAILAVVVLAGCGSAAKPLTGNQFNRVGDEMAAIEQMDSAALKDRKDQLDEEALGSEDKAVQGHARFLQGYIAEYTATTQRDDSQYIVAKNRYEEAIKTNSPYSAQARFRLGTMAAAKKAGADSSKVAKTNLQASARSTKSIFGSSREQQLWVRTPMLAGESGRATVDAKTGPTLQIKDAPPVATALLDTVYRQDTGWDRIYYKAAHAYVGLFKALSPGYGAALSLIFLALIIKIITIPFTAASYKGMRDMARVQPHLKEIQEKYKGDQVKLAEETKKLWAEHKVNPASGCVPMLIQLPIFFIVYHAVYVYAAGFADSRFLWITNLANPDIILLVLYLISMIATQKLTATPTTDPQQKMMQQQMTYMMPFMLFIFLNTIASAFVLYWFFLNVFSAAHQYYLVEKFKREDEIAAAEAAAAAPAVPTKKGKKS